MAAIRQADVNSISLIAKCRILFIVVVLYVVCTMGGGGEIQRREFDHPPLFRAFHSSFFLNPPFRAAAAAEVASGKTFSSEATR